MKRKPGRPRKSTNRAEKPGQPSEPLLTDKTLAGLLARVQKKFGPISLARASDVEDLLVVSYRPTGIPTVDQLLGGGFPVGKISEVFGAFSAGKSYLLLKTIAETQKEGKRAALVDSEVSYSPGLAKALGVRTSELLISIPECGEEALEIILALIKDNIDLVVLDSATSLVPRSIRESSPEVVGYDPTVRLWNAGLARIKPALAAHNNVCFIFSNQVRANMSAGPYAPQTIEPLGWRSKHDATLRLEIRRREWIKKGDQRIGQVTAAKVMKTKYDGCMPIGTEAHFDILFEELQHTPNGEE